MPSNKTLVAYRSKGGATEQAAKTISEVLRAKFNLDVDLVDLGKKRPPDITTYRNIVVGAGVRTGKIYKEALELLRQDFTGKKLAFFHMFHLLECPQNQFAAGVQGTASP